jgi:hypothetical protein
LGERKVESPNAAAPVAKASKNLRRGVFCLISCGNITVKFGVRK